MACKYCEGHIAAYKYQFDRAESAEAARKQWEDVATEQAEELAALQRVVNAVRAVDGFQDLLSSWAGYASEYFQKKHYLAHDLALAKDVDEALAALAAGEEV